MWEAVICGARLPSVSRQVGAHLWHDGPAGGLQWDSNPQFLNISVSRGAGSTTEPSPTPTTVFFSLVIVTPSYQMLIIFMMNCRELLLYYLQVKTSALTYRDTVCIHLTHITS